MVTTPRRPSLRAAARRLASRRRPPEALPSGTYAAEVAHFARTRTRGRRASAGAGRLARARAQRLDRTEQRRLWNRRSDDERELVTVDRVVEIEPTFGPDARQPEARNALQRRRLFDDAIVQGGGI